MSRTYVPIRYVQNKIAEIASVTVHSNVVKNHVKTDPNYRSACRVVKVNEREYWQIPKKLADHVAAEIAQRRKPAETPIITPEPAAPGTAPEPANTDAAIARLEAQIALMRDEMLGTIHRVETKVDKLLAIWDAMDDK
jgi:hypothetical protein